MTSNAAALSLLMIAEHPSLLRRLARIVGSEPAAQDVAQTLFMRLQRIEDDPPIANKRSYLFRLASNLAIDHVRAERTRERIQTEAHALLWDDMDVADPREVAVANDELARVLKAAGALPEPAKTMFRLYRIEGMRQSEVASRYGVSVTTVEKHIRRALAALRQARDAE